MSKEKKQIEDTEELRRVIRELQAKVDKMEEDDDNPVEDSEAGVLASGEYVEDSYVAYRPEDIYLEEEQEAEYQAYQDELLAAESVSANEEYIEGEEEV